MVLFVLVAFGAAWACQIPVYALELDGVGAYALLAVGAIMPSIAGVLASRGAAWTALVRGPRPAWAVAVALVAPTLLVVVAGVVSGTLRVGAPYPGSVLVPPIGEELGWRGYLQPRWSARFGAWRASVVVGVLWAIWHLPTAIGRFETFPVFFVTVVAGSVLIGWLWERSGRSLLACVAAHAGLNLGLVHAAPVATATVLVLVAAATLAARRTA